MAHPFYKELVNNPPNDYNYISSRKDVFNKANLRKINPIRKWIANKVALPLISKIGYPKITSPNVPANVCGIHSAQYLLNTKQNYVVDFEDISALTWYDCNVLKKRLSQKLLIKKFLSKECKKIIPWTNAAKYSLINSIELNEEIVDKIETVYPCFISKKISNIDKIKHEKFKFLFVGKGFYHKGGLELVEAYSELQKKYDLELTIISNVSEEVINKSKNLKGINFLSKVPQNVLEDEYKSADAFVMTTHYDTFGFVYLEAMSYGLPCIGTKQFAVPEIITNEVTGLLIENFCSRFDSTFKPVRNTEDLTLKFQNPPLSTIEELKEKMEFMICNPEKAKNMGIMGKKEVEHGKFSVKSRNKKLKEIYDCSFLV